MADLRNFLLSYTDRPFQWGRDDCSLFLADWWQANHGVDPAAHLRGAYATEADKVAIVTAAGGLYRLVASIAHKIGARRTDEPRSGDFGVVEMDGQPYAAICTGTLWAIRSETGVIFTSSVGKVRAWKV